MGCQEEGERSVGSKSYGERNERGQKLVEVCEAHDFRVLNTYFKKKKSRKWTWCSPNGTTKNEIDLVLAERKVVAKDVCALSRFDFHSDHRLVRARISFPQRRLRDEVVRRPKRTTTARIDAPLFQVALEGELQASEETHERIVTAIQTAASIAATREPVAPRISKKTEALLERRRQLKMDSTGRARVEYVAVCKAAKASWRADIKKWHRRCSTGCRSD